MTDHVVTRNIVLKLPADMHTQIFNNCTQRWDAESALARNFMPEVKNWLLAQDEKKAAFSLDHVFSNIIMVNMNGDLAEKLIQAFPDHIEKISMVEEKKTPYIPATAKAQSRHQNRILV